MIKKRYKELDSLRGIAALAVILFHYTMGRTESLLGFKLGTTGIDLFFIISGFVIFMSLNNINNSREFIANRISRLYPTYWASVTFTFSIIILYGIYKMDFSEVSIKEYLGNLTMFQYYLNIDNLEAPYWTMIIEMVFYILMLTLFHFKLLKYIDLIFVLLSTFTLFSLYYLTDNIIVNRIFSIIPLMQYLPLFHAGTLFYRLVFKQEKPLKLYTLIIICLITQIFLFNYSGRSNQYINFWENAFMLTSYFLLFTLFLNNKLGFIVNRASLFLGKISFALYLIHQKISIEFIIPILSNKLHINFWISSLIALIVSVTIAAIITNYIEVPYSRKMKNKLLQIFRIN